MLTGLIQFLVSAVTSILGVILLFRAWIFVWALSPRHPFVQMTRRTTDWLAEPLSKVIPRRGNLDLPSLVGALLVAVLTMLVEKAITGLPMTPIGMVIAPLALVIRWGLEMISWGTFLWVILTWFNPQSPLTYALGTLTEPFVRPIRRLLPMFGRFDFSPVAVILLANIGLIFVTPLSHGYIAL